MRGKIGRRDVERSVEDFAEVCLALADPFATRAAVLSETHLDERTWERLKGVWRERFAAPGPGGQQLTARFREVYVAARKRDKGEPAPIREIPSVPSESPLVAA